MKHVMIDLETLGTNPDAAIISIGACQFDPYTCEIGDTFHHTIDFNDAVRNRSVSGDTIKWWMQQSDEARSVFNRDGMELDEVLQLFRYWLPEDPIVWGNGATFDISIMEHAYDYDPPWSYRAARDMRTIVALDLLDKDSVPFEGEKHNALDDAIWQAKYVSGVLSMIRESM